jgi:2,3-diaminopropionate biosynthesis protein SbnB
MLYLDETHLLDIGIPWRELIDVLESAVRHMNDGDFVQPLKPYLRYKDPKNRIIAMPAYVGGEFARAGIKWIASFPDNIRRNMPRAHSVTILNDADTGVPAAIINAPLLSVIRTASLSGLMLKYYARERPLESFNLGIIGWGPIGRHHFRMCTELYGDRINEIYLYDLKGIDDETIPLPYRSKVRVTEDWRDIYRRADVFITCTVSEHRYVDVPPRPGSLLLHVSLRDYLPEALQFVSAVVVDNWSEVCRENTDIELLHLEKGLRAEDTMSLADVVCRNGLTGIRSEEPVLFCPMGMAVFDITVADFYVKRAEALKIGLDLK